jgi:hypothetical protein
VTASSTESIAEGWESQDLFSHCSVRHSCRGASLIKHRTPLTLKNSVFGIWRRVDLMWTDVPEERITSIYRVEKSASEEPPWAGGCPQYPLYNRLGGS